MASKAASLSARREIKELAKWRMVAKYECKCGYKWKVYQTRGGLKTCKMCLKESWPYKLRWPKENVSTYLGRTKKKKKGVWV